MVTAVIPQIRNTVTITFMLSPHVSDVHCFFIRKNRHSVRFVHGTDTLNISTGVDLVSWACGHRTGCVGETG